MINDRNTNMSEDTPTANRDSKAGLAIGTAAIKRNSESSGKPNKEPNKKPFNEATLSSLLLHHYECGTMQHNIAEQREQLSN